MAHQRAVLRRRAWRVWLLIPVVLGLDVAAALNLAGRPLPVVVIVPEAVLLAAPLLVYGILAFVVLRTWPLGLRLGTLAVLLGLHAGLVVLHTVAYIGLWSIPAPAALRLAHRWSPLIPLLQLVWVPLLALPLGTLTRRRPPARPQRGAPAPGRGDAPAVRTPHARPARAEPAREVRIEPSAKGLAPVAVAEPVPRVAPEPASPPVPVVPSPPAVGTTLEVRAEPVPAPASRGPLALVPAPTWFDQLPGSSAVDVAPAVPHAEALDDTAAGAEIAPIPVLPEAIAVRDAEAAPAVAEPVAAADGAAIAAVMPAIAATPSSTGETREDELLRVADIGPVAEVAVPAIAAIPAAEAVRRAAEPPVALELVARVFAPYGPLLSRDRAVAVDWMPGPDVPLVCVAPRERSRDHIVRLAGRLARVVVAEEASSAPGPIRRLSIRDRDGVVVLTPLDGAVLVAAAGRRGALSLLEVLSRRVGRPDGAEEPRGGEPGAAAPTSAAGPALVDPRPAPEGAPTRGGDPAVAGPVRVTTPTAWVDVVAPPGIGIEAVGALAGRLMAALADGEAAGAAELGALNVELPAHRLVIHPIDPRACPPRFVAVVGGSEPPGLLGRRAERAARTLREAS
jgi:hypothetical protein